MDIFFRTLIAVICLSAQLTRSLGSLTRRLQIRIWNNLDDKHRDHDQSKDQKRADASLRIVGKGRETLKRKEVISRALSIKGQKIIGSKLKRSMDSRVNRSHRQRMNFPATFFSLLSLSFLYILPLFPSPIILLSFLLLSLYVFDPETIFTQTDREDDGEKAESVQVVIATKGTKKEQKKTDKTIKNRGRLLSSSLSVFSVGRQI